MSKLSATAPLFVPRTIPPSEKPPADVGPSDVVLPPLGDSAKTPQPSQSGTTTPQAEVVTPPPTISLNIGRSTPSTTVRAPAPAPAPAPAATAPVPASAPTASSKTIFSTAKSQTNTESIAKEVQAAADQEVLKDLYGNGGLQGWVSFRFI